MHRIWIGLGILGAVCTAPADAQMIMTNPSQWYVNNQIYSMRVFHSAIANSTLGRRTGAGSRGRGSRGTAAAPAPPTFYRESAISPVPAMLAANSAGLGGNSAEAQRLFHSYIDMYKTTARQNGFEHNDLAFAYTYFVVNNYAIYNELMDVPYEKDPRALREADGFGRITAMGTKRTLMVTPQRSRAVYEQFLAQLSDNAEIKRMTDAQKQESAELLATMFGVNRTAYMAGIDAINDRQAQQGRELARAGLEKLLGVPVGQITITHIGLDLTPP
jgi:hypothetical protein